MPQANNISKDNIKYINFYPRNIDNIDIDCGADLHFLKQNQPNLKYKNFKTANFVINPSTIQP